LRDILVTDILVICLTVVSNLLSFSYIFRDSDQNDLIFLVILKHFSPWPKTDQKNRFHLVFSKSK